METKAHHVLIGCFVLLFAAGILVSIAWLARVDVTREFAYYDIYFTDSVAGLGLGGDVRFNGIKVGSVSEIRIDRDNPSRVMVTAEIDREVPIRTDSHATLQLWGVTGVVFVQISGGSNEGGMVEYEPGGPHPVIPSRPSKIAQLLEGAPDLLARASDMLERANALLTVENERRFTQILDDASKLSAALARRGGEIDRMLGSADVALQDIGAAARAARGLAERSEKILGGAEDLVDRDVKALLQEARRSAQGFGRAAQELQALIAENRAPLNAFTGDSLRRFSRFVDEARQLVAALGRLTERVENDPARLLFGDRAPEYRPQ